MIFIGSSEVSIEGIGFVYKGSTLLWPTPHGELPDIHILPTSVDTVWRGLKEDYDSISSKSDNVLYLIEEEEKASGQKQVNFIDYDGTIIASYTAEEWSTVTTLPANPEHDGLTSQGWNWTLQEITSQLTAAPGGPVWVGQMYITESGDTEIDISLPEGRTNPYLGCAVDGTISIDWGDGSAASTVTGTSLESQIRTLHAYEAAGEYTIVIHVVSGSMSFYAAAAYSLLGRNSSTANSNRVYANCVTGIRLGKNTDIGNYAFNYCCSLTAVTIPKTVTSICNSAFSGCYSLTTVTIPAAVTSIENYAFTTCYSLTSVSIPKAVTSIGSYAFNYCFSLTTVTIPAAVTSIGSYAFNNCSSLTAVTIPETVTSIGSYAFIACYSIATVTIPETVTSISEATFSSCHSLTSVTIPEEVTSIGNGAFTTCYSLTSITIPAEVTSIGNNAFSNCYGMAEYHFLSETPPTLGGTNVFSNIPSDCIIYVPEASLDTYKAASRWSTHASKMVGE